VLDYFFNQHDDKKIQINKIQKEHDRIINLNMGGAHTSTQLETGYTGETKKIEYHANVNLFQ